MRETVFAIAVMAATIYAGEWLVEGWLGEARRHWLAIGGLGLSLLSAAIIQASGIHAVTRILRRMLIGAWLGRALSRLSLSVPWLRRALRWGGLETEPDARSGDVLAWSHWQGWVLALGVTGGLVGLALIWTGLNAV